MALSDVSENCSIKDWVNSPNLQSSIVCKVHGCVFSISERCPMRSGKIVEFPSEAKKIVEQGVEQGVTLSNKVSQRVSGVDVVSASVRSHAFRFVVYLDSPVNWSDRRRILESKGFKVDPKAGIGRIFMTVFQGFKVWLADKSITVYFPSWKQYFVDEARFGYNFALADLRELLNELAVACDSSFVVDGAYKFRCSGQHHALIHNALARMFNRKKEKLQVFDRDGVLWLLVDDSHPDGVRLNELETVRPTVDNLDENVLVKRDYNDLRENGLTRGAIAESLAEVARIQKESVLESSRVRSDVDERLAWMTENFKTHQRVLEKMEASLDVMVVLKRRDRVRDVKSDWGW